MDEEVGLIVFHEMMHIRSCVVDHPEKPYAKSDVVELAIDDPVMARLNSGSYQMYVADAGLNRDDFSKFTRGQGPNAANYQCKDQYMNCHQ